MRRAPVPPIGALRPVVIPAYSTRWPSRSPRWRAQTGDRYEGSSLRPAPRVRVETWPLRTAASKSSRAVSLNPEALVPLQTPSHRCGETDGVGETTRRRGEPSARNAELDGVLTIPKIWLLLAFDVKLPVAQRGPRQLGIQRVLLCLSTASSITASRYVSRGIRGRLRQAHSTAESGRSSGNGPNASPIFSACPPPPTLSSSS
jgi:hypothetical protein